MAETRRLRLLVEETLAEIDLGRGPVTVALSGGADSGALAHLCSVAGVETSAIHVDHGLPGSPTLREAATSIAARLAIPLRTVEVELGEGPSPEERAREARYQVLHQVAGRVLTAHTLDDNAETMLINLVRGTGSAGLRGIPTHRLPNVYRPLLVVPRDRTREIAALTGLPFVDDPANFDMTLTRNRIRHFVMPRLRELNPRVEEALARAGATLGRDADYLESMTPEVPHGGLPVGLVLTLEPPLADRALGRLLESHGIAVSADRLHRMRAVARGEADRHDLAEGRSVVRRHALIVVE